MKRILALFSMAVWTLLFRSILSIPWSVLIMKIFQEKSLVPMGQDPIITPTEYSAKMRWMAESSLRSVHRTHCIACWTLRQDWNWRDWMIPNWFLYITSTRISDTVIFPYGFPSLTTRYRYRDKSNPADDRMLLQINTEEGGAEVWLI